MVKITNSELIDVTLKYLCVFVTKKTKKAKKRQKRQKKDKKKQKRQKSVE